MTRICRPEMSLTLDGAREIHAASVTSLTVEEVMDIFQAMLAGSRGMGEIEMVI